tara:strand:- start:15373 stop:17637 length:2265 start_codon:yes stop_codon:yes gene_type:complete
MKFNEQHLKKEDEGFSSSFFLKNALGSLKSRLFLVLCLSGVVVPVFGAEKSDDLDRDGFESLHQKMVRALDESKKNFKYVEFCDLARLYIELFPHSDKCDEYILELYTVKEKLLELGRGSIAAKGLASVEVALYLGSHCFIFPNSHQSIEYFDRAARAAGSAELTALETELRARVLEASKTTPGYSYVRDLAANALLLNRDLVAINGLKHFQSGEYGVEKSVNFNIGPSLILSGDIYRASGFFDQAITKYSEALLWCGDIRGKASAMSGRSVVTEIESDNGALTFHSGSDSAIVSLKMDDGRLGIEEVSIEGMLIPEMIDFELSFIERNANILIGRSMIEDAKKKSRSTSTTGFAGKLYEKAVNHFSALLESVSLNDYSSMPYRLELLRASIELARYKNGLKHGGQSEAVYDFARCVSAAESYLRMVPRTDEGVVEGRGQLSLMEEEVAEHASEVAYILIESLIEIGRLDGAVEAFAVHFSGKNLQDVWAMYSMLQLSSSYLDNKEYLRALPYLAEVSVLGDSLGVPDLAFVAGLMKGICIKRLAPSRTVLESNQGGLAQNQEGVILSGDDRGNNEYNESARKFGIFKNAQAMDYPEIFRSMFIDEIREEVIGEFKSDPNGGQLVAALQTVASGSGDSLGNLLAEGGGQRFDSLFRYDESSEIVEKNSEKIRSFGGFHPYTSIIPGRLAKFVEKRLDVLKEDIEADLQQLINESKRGVDKLIEGDSESLEEFRNGIEGESNRLKWNPFEKEDVL